MIDERFIFLAVGLNVIGTLSYLIGTIKGKTKPNKVTWFLWALAPLIAFSAEISQGVGLRALMTFAVGFGPLLILLASFVNRKAEWKITKFDLICGAISLVGLALWAQTRVGNYAIVFAIFADGLAAIPTLIKSHYYPETEDYRAYFFAAVSAFIALLTVKRWDFVQFSFPAWTLLLCVVFVLVIKFKLGKRFF